MNDLIIIILLIIILYILISLKSKIFKFIKDYKSIKMDEDIAEAKRIQELRKRNINFPK